MLEVIILLLVYAVPFSGLCYLVWKLPSHRMSGLIASLVFLYALAILIPALKDGNFAAILAPFTFLLRFLFPTHEEAEGGAK